MSPFIKLSILLVFCVSGSLQSHTPCKRGWGRGDHFPYPSHINIKYCGDDDFRCTSKDNITLTFTYTPPSTVDNVSFQARRWTGWFYNFNDVAFGQVNTCSDYTCAGLKTNVCNRKEKGKLRFLGGQAYSVEVSIPVHGYDVKQHAVQFLLKNSDGTHDVKECIEVKFNYRG